MTKDAIINDIEKHLSDSVKQYYNHENQVFGPQKTRRRNLK